MASVSCSRHVDPFSRVFQRCRVADSKSKMPVPSSPFVRSGTIRTRPSANRLYGSFHSLRLTGQDWRQKCTV